MVKSVKGVGQGEKAKPETLEGLCKLIYLEANEVDFVKVVVPHHGLGAKNKPRLRKRALIDVFVLPWPAGAGNKGEELRGFTKVAAPLAPGAVHGADLGPLLSP